MRVFAAFAALCVFIALLASPGEAEGDDPAWIVPVVMHHDLPRAKPDRNQRAALPKGVSIVRQCEASTMMARVIAGTDMRAFYARYSETAFAEMLSAGCTEIQKGCNTCAVVYTGCTVEQRAACTDGDCLAQVCQRKMRCTAKGCSAVAHKAPPCEARFARQACLASAFDPLDSVPGPRE